MPTMEARTGLHSAYHQGKQGSLHLTVYLPDSGAASDWVVHVPAFAEEMNKSRAVVSHQARELTRLGHAVIVLDPYGTGDSEGGFEQANWNLWVEDLVDLCETLRIQGVSGLTLWGHRLGCLLATEAATRLKKPPDQLMLWQPVHSGRQQLTQFLRVRMAATMAGNATSDESMAALRQRLESGESIEVAGYSLAGKFYQQLSDRSLQDYTLSPEPVVTVVEVATGANMVLTPVTQKQLALWEAGGVRCEGIAVTGNAFWMTQELAEAPELIRQTTSWFSSHRPCTQDVGVSMQDLLLDPVAKSSNEDILPLVFNCEGKALVGLLHKPHGAIQETGVVIVVGGPQYRAGSHRQFVSLASSLARHGVPVFRFDFRGMGDSEGEHPGFIGLDSDIRCAIDTFVQATGLHKVVIWGLCDAATAAVTYAPGDERVVGLVLANPWVYSPEGSARAYLRYYYIQRLFSRTFWNKVLAGKFNLAGSVRSIFQLLGKSRAQVGGSTQAPAPLEEQLENVHSAETSPDLVALFASSLKAFHGRVLLILSGRDLVAAEFKDAGKSDPGLRRVLARGSVETLDFPGFDHTFSHSSAQSEVERCTLEYLRKFDLDRS